MKALLLFENITDEAIEYISQGFQQFRNMILIVSLETKDNGLYNATSDD